MKENSKFTDMRRKDRAVEDDAWIVDVLHQAAYGNIATVNEGQPFITMTVFVYDPETHALYMHTSRHGRLCANVGNGSNVCFSVGKVGRMLPADTAREFSNEYESVVIFGKIEILADLKKARDMMHLMIDKYFPHLKREVDYREITLPEIQEIATYKITIDSWSGKRKKAEKDFPGAFLFNS